MIRTVLCSPETIRSVRCLLALRVEPNGRASVQLAEYKEASRDFTRTLLASTQDILLLSEPTAAAAAAAADTPPRGKDMEQPVATTDGPLDDDNAVALAGLTLQPVACETKGIGDVNEVRSVLSFNYTLCRRSKVLAEV
eukprot:COSAG02_NODE_794_length_17142_cov_13.622367_5_plen_139_part_00